tara:strand:+ start:91 stop:219 length:129 start_codon:yes stop_codon:yes gene_type:complete
MITQEIQANINNHISNVYFIDKSAKAKPTVIIRPMYLASAGR